MMVRALRAVDLVANSPARPAPGNGGAAKESGSDAEASLSAFNAHEQNANAEFATSVSGFRVHTAGRLSAHAVQVQDWDMDTAAIDPVFRRAPTVGAAEPVVRPECCLRA